MTRSRTLLERLRNTFWVFPAVGIVLGALLGLVLSGVDQDLRLPEAISFNGGADTARTLLQAVVTLTVSVAGISFSVIVVALVLASQQLSPRVLRSFQRNPLNQSVLGVFLGTSIYAVCVLSSVDDDPADRVPEFSISIAVVLAALSLVLFVVFLHHVLRSLNASAVIRRIAAEGHQAIEDPYPRAAGCEVADEASVEASLEKELEHRQRHEVTAPRAGYLATVKATELIEIARRSDTFIEQRAMIGEFVLTGGPLGTVWSDADIEQDCISDVCDAFVLNEERMVDHDIAFPIRQLADVALKGLSPSVNDPTTSENAMDSLTDNLVRIARQNRGSLLRLDDDGVGRLRVSRPEFDDLVRLGFDQVRRDAADRPSFSVRLIELLAALRSLGGDLAGESTEIKRQAALITEAACAGVALDADRALIEHAYSRFRGERSREDGEVALRT